MSKMITRFIVADPFMTIFNYVKRFSEKLGKIVYILT